MRRYRIIPCLQLLDGSLVKTVRYEKPKYVGDPINTVRIFNELEVDELCFLDIRATVNNHAPDYELLKKISEECFMPLSYGGGLHDFDAVAKIFALGFEKVVVNSALSLNPDLVRKIAEHYGEQALIGAIDVKKTLLSGYRCHIKSGKEKVEENAVAYAKRAEQLGVGELLLTSIDREGTWSGYDTKLIGEVAESVRIPVIANGGAGSKTHIEEAIAAGASAVAVGSTVVYQQKDMGVLINFPYNR